MGTSPSARKNAGPSDVDIEIVPLPHALGAEVRCGDVRKLDAAGKAAVHQAFLDHLVLLFPRRSTTTS